MERSAEALKSLLCDFSQSESKYRAVLQEYVCVRFGLDNESEENIGALAILSIRKQYPDMQKEEAAKRLGIRCPEKDSHANGAGENHRHAYSRRYGRYRKRSFLYIFAENGGLPCLTP